MSRKKKAGIYQFLITIPDRFYPFSVCADGKRVRGRMSYKKAITQATRRYGPGHYGITILTYRQIFHLVGSILFIIFATILSKLLFGSDVAVYVLLVAAIAA